MAGYSNVLERQKNTIFTFAVKFTFKICRSSDNEITLTLVGKNYFKQIKLKTITQEKVNTLQ